MNRGSVSPLARLCLAAFLADTALYLTMTGAPYKALALGAGPVILGLLPAARALPYSLSTVWAGGRTEGRERLSLARVTLLVAAAAVAALVFLPGLVALFLLLAVLGTGLAFFWPAIQATLADEAGHGAVTGSLGWFNISWSSGKAAGFLVGGALLARFGFPALFTTSAVALLAVVLLLTSFRPRRPQATGPRQDNARPRGGPPGAGSPPPAEPLRPGGEEPAALPQAAEPAAAPIPTARAARFRLAAWTANAVSFGAVAVLNLQYPEWLQRIGHGEALFGTYLGLIFVAQTAAFALLARFPGWRHRKAPLLAAQVPLAAAMAVLPLLHAPALILATAPLVGVGIGVSYFASLFYSVADPAHRGRNAGIHEALLGVGSLLIPVLGGWIAQETARLEAPYLFAAAVSMVSIAGQARVLGGSGSPKPGTGPAAAG